MEDELVRTYVDRLFLEWPEESCEVCYRHADDCLCPRCPECGEHGNGQCYARPGETPRALWPWRPNRSHKRLLILTGTQWLHRAKGLRWLADFELSQAKWWRERAERCVLASLEEAAALIATDDFSPLEFKDRFTEEELLQATRKFYAHVFAPPAPESVHWPIALDPRTTRDCVNRDSTRLPLPQDWTMPTTGDIDRLRRLLVTALAPAGLSAAAAIQDLADKCEAGEELTCPDCGQLLQDVGGVLGCLCQFGGVWPDPETLAAAADAAAAKQHDDYPQEHKTYE